MLVQVAAGFVQQHTTRLAHQGPGDSDPLAFAAGQLCRFVAEAFAQSHPLQHPAGTALDLALGQAPNQQRHGDVFQCTELSQQMVKLVDEAQEAVAQFTAPLFGQFRDRLVVDPHFSRTGKVQSPQHVEQGRLARARGAHDRQLLTAGYRQIHAL